MCIWICPTLWDVDESGLLLFRESKYPGLFHEAPITKVISEKLGSKRLSDLQHFLVMNKCYFGLWLFTSSHQISLVEYCGLRVEVVRAHSQRIAILRSWYWEETSKISRSRRYLAPTSGACALQGNLTRNIDTQNLLREVRRKNWS